MRLASFLSLTALFAFHLSGQAAEPAPASSAKLLTLTLQVEGIECLSCVEMVRQSICDLPSLTDFDVVQQFEPYATVAFDPAKLSVDDIAQAILASPQLHGRPYQPSLLLNLPDYAKQPGMAAKVDAIFAAQTAWVSIDALDAAKGEFIIRFLPAPADKPKAKAPSWDYPRFIASLRDPAPKGLGLKVEQPVIPIR